MKKIPITGVTPHDQHARILGYAVCRQWKDNPKNVDVYEYAESLLEARGILSNCKREQKEDGTFSWFIGVYQ